MTKAKHPDELKRPRRRLSVVLGDLLHCPLCWQNQFGGPGGRVVAFRSRTVRLECIGCGLRWSIDLRQLVSVLLKPENRERPMGLLSRDEIPAGGREAAAQQIIEYGILARPGESAEERRARIDAFWARYGKEEDN
jgi:hypothetical protein